MPINVITFCWLVLKGSSPDLEMWRQVRWVCLLPLPADLSALRVGGKAEAPDAIPGPVWIWCCRDGTQSRELPEEVFALAS